MKYEIFEFREPIHICPGDKFILTVSRGILARGLQPGQKPGKETVHTYEFTNNRRLTHYARVEFGPVSIGYVVGDEQLEYELQAAGGTKIE